MSIIELDASSIPGSEYIPIVSILENSMARNVITLKSVASQVVDSQLNEYSLLLNDQKSENHFLIVKR
jgi:hypothetical protein